MDVETDVEESLQRTFASIIKALKSEHPDVRAFAQVALDLLPTVTKAALLEGDTEPAARWREACNGICGAMNCPNDPDALPVCVGLARTALRALGAPVVP